MAEEAIRPRLGRGLAALIGEAGDDFGGGEVRGQRKVPVEFLRPNPRNPRKDFPEHKLDELAASIRQRGIIQPIVVRPLGNLADVYEIVAGERRWRAAQRAELHEVPIVVVDVDDRTSLEFAIVENVQRSDLNAIEEAAGYERLMREFTYSQDDLARILGRSRSHVSNMLRLLNLAPSIQGMISDGRLTAGHARALLSVRDPEGIARKVVEKGLNVRDVERLAQENREEASKPAAPKPRREKDPDTRALEQALEDVLGLVVRVEHGADGGEVLIRYKTLEQLDGLCRRLRATGD